MRACRGKEVAKRCRGRVRHRGVSRNRRWRGGRWRGCCRVGARTGLL